MTQLTPASTPDRLAAVYQLKIHLLGISPQISRRVLVQGDTTLAELHHVFQVVMGWENWHLHSFHLWGKDYGLSYAGGTWYADDARRVHLGDFAWRVNDKFTYTYDFGDYWQHQVRVEKVLPPPVVSAIPVCVSGQRACPPEEVGGPSGYDRRSLDQFSWRYEALDRLLAGEDIREDDVPTWFWTFQPEHFDKAQVNESIKKCGAIELSGHRHRFRWQWPEAGVLLPKTLLPLLVEHLGAGLYEEVRAFPGPLHLLSLDQALGKHLVHRRLDKAGRHALAVALALGVVHDGGAILLFKYAS